MAQAKQPSPNLIFLWLNSYEISIKRVAKRVESGGHSIPEDIIQRRYKRGFYNFYYLYKDLVTSWELYNNSSIEELSLIAEKIDDITTIHEEALWKNLQPQK